MPAVSYSPVYSCKLVREGSIKTRPNITGADKAKEIACELLRDKPNEALVVIMLDIRLHVIGSMVVTEGLLDSSLVHPREVFRPAIICNASAVVIAHNHPSGHVDPSRQDKDTCQQLKKCGDLLGIHMLDFIIVNSDDESLSFANVGIL